MELGRVGLNLDENSKHWVLQPIHPIGKTWNKTCKEEEQQEQQTLLCTSKAKRCMKRHQKDPKGDTECAQPLPAHPSCSWSPLYSPQERESLQVNLGEGRKGRATVVRSTALPPKSVCNTLSEPLSRSVPLHTLGRRTAPAIQRPHVLGFSSASSNALPAKLLAAQRGGNLVIVTSKRFSIALFRSCGLGLRTLTKQEFGAASGHQQ